LDLNRLSFLSEKFVNQIEYLTSLSLSDNPTLKSWDPFINRLGKLKYLEELILNNCSIDQIESETAKQMIIAHLPNLIYLNRVAISQDDRHGAEIDYIYNVMLKIL
jgi:hypothetical protein